MRDLLAREATDPRAAEAVALFCYTARKYLGALIAALGGLDTLDLHRRHRRARRAGRERICAGLEFLGILPSATMPRMTPTKHRSSGPRMARAVLRGTASLQTDEDSMIA